MRLISAILDRLRHVYPIPSSGAVRRECLKHGGQQLGINRFPALPGLPQRWNPKMQGLGVDFPSDVSRCFLFRDDLEPIFSDSLFKAISGRNEIKRPG